MNCATTFVQWTLNILSALGLLILTAALIQILWERLRPNAR